MTFRASEMFYGSDKKDASAKKRANFLSRIFGIISEEVVGLWLSDNEIYENLNERPLLIANNDPGKKVTLDFTIMNKRGEIFIVEQKNLFAYKNGSLCSMDDNQEFSNSFKKWSESKIKMTPAFKYFIGFSKNQEDYTVKLKNSGDISGTILIWSSCTDRGKKKYMMECGFKDVLSVENMLNDLIRSKNSNYKKWIDERKAWIDDLFKSFE